MKQKLSFFFLVGKRGHDVFQLLKETKERVKHGTRMLNFLFIEKQSKKQILLILECLPPSKYFAGSCYTYMKMLPATSWNGAYNNCLTLPMTKDARLLVIDSITEYEFVERELIGPKSGSDSVSVYVGLRKINSKSYNLIDFFSLFFRQKTKILFRYMALV